eukprot:snap_masked-scaffold_2-processed-gene-11.23-mRNA-1 protein AED:0.25 eAED:1.00 QI:0/0/0/1/1/1/2/0/274
MTSKETTNIRYKPQRFRFPSNRSTAVSVGTQPSILRYSSTRVPTFSKLSAISSEVKRTKFRLNPRNTLNPKDLTVIVNGVKTSDNAIIRDYLVNGWGAVIQAIYLQMTLIWLRLVTPTISETVSARSLRLRIRTMQTAAPLVFILILVILRDPFIISLFAFPIYTLLVPSLIKARNAFHKAFSYGDPFLTRQVELVNRAFHHLFYAGILFTLSVAPLAVIFVFIESEGRIYAAHPEPGGFNYLLWGSQIGREGAGFWICWGLNSYMQKVAQSRA